MYDVRTTVRASGMGDAHMRKAAVLPSGQHARPNHRQPREAVVRVIPCPSLAAPSMTMWTAATRRATVAVGSTAAWPACAIYAFVTEQRGTTMIGSVCRRLLQSFLECLYLAFAGCACVALSAAAVHAADKTDSSLLHEARTIFQPLPKDAGTADSKRRGDGRVSSYRGTNPTWATSLL
jgi:hypothetical protein